MEMVSIPLKPTIIKRWFNKPQTGKFYRLSHEINVYKF